MTTDATCSSFYFCYYSDVLKVKTVHTYIQHNIQLFLMDIYQVDLCSLKVSKETSEDC